MSRSTASWLQCGNEATQRSTPPEKFFAKGRFVRGQSRQSSSMDLWTLIWKVVGLVVEHVYHCKHNTFDVANSLQIGVHNLSRLTKPVTCLYIIRPHFFPWLFWSLASVVTISPLPGLGMLQDSKSIHGSRKSVIRNPTAVWTPQGSS